MPTADLDRPPLPADDYAAALLREPTASTAELRDWLAERFREGDRVEAMARAEDEPRTFASVRTRGG